jgi:hypothetical protein
MEADFSKFTLPLAMTLGDGMIEGTLAKNGKQGYPITGDICQGLEEW